MLHPTARPSHPITVDRRHAAHAARHHLAAVYAAALLLAAGCTAQVNDPAGDDSLEGSSSGALTTTTQFTGSLSASGKSWVVHEMPMPAANTNVTATLSWGTSTANLNLFAYADSSSTAFAYANGTARPEVLKFAGRSGTKLRFGIKAKSGSTSYTLKVDVTSADAPPPPPPTETCALDAFPARPAAGKLFWGAAVSGNGDPVARHEIPAGVPLSLRRTFFQWSARASGMVTMAKNDIAAGRLPWVSVKPPSWAAMAAGQHDAEIDQMLKALDALPGPVWLTVHHEPEGGGGVNSPDDPAGPAGHLAMNKRVRARMTALKTDNIALAPILMAYTWQKASGRDPNAWWADGVYDFLGIDHYRESTNTLLTSTWYDVRQWAEDRCVPVAVGEWGIRGSDAASANYLREWYNAAANSSSDASGAPVIGLSAFDSALNSPSGSWELTGEQLKAFHEKLRDPRTARIK